MIVIYGYKNCFSSWNCSGFSKCKIFLQNDIQVKALYQSEFAIWTKGMGAIIPRVLAFA